MAFKFNAILKFNSTQANRALSKSGRKFAALSKSVAKANASLRKMGAGIKGLAIATTPVAFGVGLITREAASFEVQMSTVQSVLLATKEELRPVNF